MNEQTNNQMNKYFSFKWAINCSMTAFATDGTNNARGSDSERLEPSLVSDCAVDLRELHQLHLLQVLIRLV